MRQSWLRRWRALVPAVFAICLPYGAAMAQSAPDPAPVRRVLDLQGRVLDLDGKVLDIVGISKGIEGALKDLGAKVTQTEIHIELAADVLFDFDKATLRPQATEALHKVGEVLRSYPDRPVIIEGHTDGKGSDAYNQKLSEARAVSVKTWLVQNGVIVAKRMITRGWGKNKPVAPNSKPDGSDDPQGRQKNRRVEITLKKG